MMRKDKGSALIPVLITSLALVAICAGIYSMVLNRVRLNQTMRSYGTRDAFAATLDRVIRDPASLNQSLFDQSCVRDRFSTGSPEDIYSSKTCFIDSSSLPQETSAQFPGATSFDLYSATQADPATPSGLKRVAGTVSNPVYYDESGAVCADKNAASCQLEAIALYNWQSSSALNPNGPSVQTKYILRGKTLSNLASTSMTRAVAMKLFSASAETSFAALSRVANPADYRICRNASMTSQPGNITYDLKFLASGTTPYPPTANSTDSPVCTTGLGVQLCPGNSYQVGANADGSPICSCSGATCDKGVCASGQVAVEVQNGATGGFKMACMDSSCASKTVAGDAVPRMGFVAPMNDGLAHTAPVNCILMQPLAGCEDKAKDTVIGNVAANAGRMPCSPQTSIPPVGCPSCGPVFVPPPVIVPPATYHWVIQGWGACPASCTQTRTVYCADQTNATVADANCAAPKPTTSQACSTNAACTAVPHTYSWTSTAWAACDATCSQARAVSCVDDQTSLTVPDSNCLAATKPTAAQACTTNAACTPVVVVPPGPPDFCNESIGGTWGSAGDINGGNSTFTFTANATATVPIAIGYQWENDDSPRQRCLSADANLYLGFNNLASHSFPDSGLPSTPDPITKCGAPNSGAASGIQTSTLSASLVAGQTYRLVFTTFSTSVPGNTGSLQGATTYLDASCPSTNPVVSTPPFDPHATPSPPACSAGFVPALPGTKDCCEYTDIGSNQCRCDVSVNNGLTCP